MDFQLPLAAPTARVIAAGARPRTVVRPPARARCDFGRERSWAVVLRLHLSLSLSLCLCSALLDYAPPRPARPPPPPGVAIKRRDRRDTRCVRAAALMLPAPGPGPRGAAAAVRRVRGLRGTRSGRRALRLEREREKDLPASDACRRSARPRGGFGGSLMDCLRDGPPDTPHVVPSCYPWHACHMAPACVCAFLNFYGRQ
jgi:hypothetical protein